MSRSGRFLFISVMVKPSFFVPSLTSARQIFYPAVYDSQSVAWLGTNCSVMKQNAGSQLCVGMRILEQGVFRHGTKSLSSCLENTLEILS